MDYRTGSEAAKLTIVFPVPVLALTKRSCFPLAAVETFCPTTFVCMTSSPLSTTSTADDFGFPPDNSGMSVKTLFCTSLIAVSWNGLTVKALRIFGSTRPLRLENGVVAAAGFEDSEESEGPGSSIWPVVDDSEADDRVDFKDSGMTAFGMMSDTKNSSPSSCACLPARDDEVFHLDDDCDKRVKLLRPMEIS